MGKIVWTPEDGWTDNSPEARVILDESGRIHAFAHPERSDVEPDADDLTAAREDMPPGSDPEAVYEVAARRARERAREADHPAGEACAGNASPGHPAHRRNGEED